MPNFTYQNPTFTVVVMGKVTHTHVSKSLGDPTGSLPRLKFFRQKIWSGHRLAVSSADETSLRRSHPHARKAVCVLLFLAHFVRCGEGGIRTLDKVLKPYNRLATCRLQPLGHLSINFLGRASIKKLCLESARETFRFSLIALLARD